MSQTDREIKSGSVGDYMIITAISLRSLLLDSFTVCLFQLVMFMYA